MKLPSLIAACALFALASSEPWSGNMAAAGDKGLEAQKLLQQAEDLTDIRSSGSRSFHLAARVYMYEGKDLAADGTYDLFWASPTAWREEIKFAHFSQVRVAIGDKLSISRNPPILPLEIFRLHELLDFPNVLHPNLAVKPGKVKERTRNGSRERTIEVGSRIVILDGSSPIPIRVEFKSFHFEYQFKDYVSFDGRQFPRTLAEFILNRPLVQVQVQKLEQAAFDASFFIPPKDATVLRWCPHPEPAKLEDLGALSLLPSQLRDAAHQHVAAIYGIIGIDGRWHDLAVVKSAGKEVDSYWMDQMLQQRYTPAKCAGVPVEQESVKEHHYEWLGQFIVPN
ncbi:MAG: hypothetical protein LAN61_03520 [Acidobacteriia bacterium]|nr:hypothetical protein [Terriglobia bacterium]